MLLSGPFRAFVTRVPAVQQLRGVPWPGAQLEVLNTLERNDPEGRWHCVSLREWFNYRGHVCMSFEKLGLSLYDFLRRNSYSPFHVNLVRACAPEHVLPERASQPE